MSLSPPVIQTIQQAFAGGVYPGDGFLVGSTDGCEPEEEVGPFRGKTDWRTLGASFLDAQAGALNFFSEAALRFYLPGYLIADVQGELEHADPLFILTHGFSDLSISVPVGEETFTIRTGRNAFVNPHRFGAMTFGDHARARLAVFAREEAVAIVEYLKYKRSMDRGELDTPKIEAALDLFWRERALTAPSQAQLQQHLDDQNAYMKAISRPPE